MAEDRDNTGLERAMEIVNCIKFQIDLWKKVELVVEEDGTKRAINGEYRDDPLFPTIRVRGYNEWTKKEEEYYLPCYAILSDWTSRDWEEEYEQTGESPAFSFPEGTRCQISCQINDLEMNLRGAQERLKAEKKLAAQPKDMAMYYLLGDSLVGKRNEGKDYLFMSADWFLDEEGIMKKLLKGEDITTLTFETFDPEALEMINSIKGIKRKQAMEMITDQTVCYMLTEWSKKFAERKTDWDHSPEWFSKLVSIHFILNGIEKTIYPKDFIFEDGTAADGFIESISEEISEDIRKAGGFVTGVYGMMD